MNLFPFFSIPISKEELVELRDNLDRLLSDDRQDRELQKFEQLGEPFNLGRTEHVKIDVIPVVQGKVYNLGFLHNVSTPVLSKEDINKIFKDNKDLFGDIENTIPTVESEIDSPSK